MAANYTLEDVCNAKSEEEFCNCEPTIRRPNTIMRDNLVTNMLSTLHDSTCAAWNGWEQACKFESPEQQDYYMKLVSIIQKFKTDLQKIKKPE